ncbi:2-succinyl-6-hydroxy-2, 4-cyclohexadiene-1-carboxylate synthase [Oleiphilus messinensis]|uniref:2-succinyl-5-enolpyruvyl-6-hydroxy-3-cyclohexene-1-carboxylate synthase n=2 Tax=Oleiphilus messinensis TaxID=141451 RepID=A0A1Y0I9B4_9GAMM|nr:2-succinyl-6-hydroxy-2, 4-cyclohexadiene-1-carboxylate synthase [Oleiphilus messinensis]
MHFPQYHHSHNDLWARLVLEELYRFGVRACCIAPGSRNTPLTLNAIKVGFDIYRHFDERSLGFFALGLIKTSECPVVVITTSGTAVANLYPAVVEAYQTGMPLIIISADRPPRLHNCGANQSIPQSGIFTHFSPRSINFGCPDPSVSPESILTDIDRVMVDQKPGNGHVTHINMMFDEPLYPESGQDKRDFSGYLSAVNHWCASDNRATFDRIEHGGATDYHTRAVSDSVAHHQLDSFFARPGFVVVGALHCDADVQAVKRLIEELAWPVIVDSQSQLKGMPDTLSSMDLLLAENGDTLLRRYTELSAGECNLLQLGGRLVSKRIQAFIESRPWREFWVVHPGEYPLAPGHNFSAFIASAIPQFCDKALAALANLKSAVGSDARRTTGLSPSLRMTLLRAQAELQGEIRAWLGIPDTLTEVEVFKVLIPRLNSAFNLFIGNSLAIRAFEMIAGVYNYPSSPKLIANRGASGIDGLLAAACGSAMGNGRVTFCVLGDTSLLHDLNSLHWLSKLNVPVIVILLNNGGGGIFHHLPIPDTDLRRDFYTLPHSVNFGAAAQAFAVTHKCVETLSALENELEDVFKSPKHTVLEVRIDPDSSYQQMRTLVERSAYFIRGKTSSDKDVLK